MLVSQDEPPQGTHFPWPIDKSCCRDRNFYLSFWSDNVAINKIVLGFYRGCKVTSNARIRIKFLNLDIAFASFSIGYLWTKFWAATDQNTCLVYPEDRLNKGTRGFRFPCHKERMCFYKSIRRVPRSILFRLLCVCTQPLNQPEVNSPRPQIGHPNGYWQSHGVSFLEPRRPVPHRPLQSR